MGVERELKLEGRPDELRSLLQDPTIAACMRGRPKRKQLAATYYDTEDGSLRTTLGMSLRVRREGKRFVQTVKREANSNGILMTRGEWEMPLDDDRPDPTRLTDPALAELVTTLTSSAILPFARTEIRRDTVDLDWTDEHGSTALLNLALDDGRIEAGEASSTVSELELELLEGDPACLFSLALRMAELVPVRFGTQGKWERGCRLHMGRAPQPEKAVRPHLSPDMNIEEVLVATFGAALHQWLGNEPAVRESAAPDAVHQMRVALRRLRSLLSLFKGLIPTAQRTAFSGELRSIVQALGAARDLDVFTDGLLTQVQDARPADPAPPVLRTLVERARVDAYDQARLMLDSKAYGRTLLRLSAWLELRGWRTGPDAVSAERLAEDPVAAAGRLLDRALRKVKHRGHGFAGLSPPERHKVRIALKKLRYGAEAFSALFDAARVKTYVRRLSRLQDLMGRYNDAALTGQIVDRLLNDSAQPLSERHAAAMAGGLVIGWHARAVRADEGDLADAWRGFKHAKPFWRKSA